MKGNIKAKEGIKAFWMSFFVMLLVIAVFALCIFVAYRIENMINIDPVVVFTLTDNSNGHYAYTFFNLQGKIDLSWAYEIGDRIKLYF